MVRSIQSGADTLAGKAVRNLKAYHCFGSVGFYEFDSNNPITFARRRS